MLLRPMTLDSSLSRLSIKYSLPGFRAIPLEFFTKPAKKLNCSVAIISSIPQSVSNSSRLGRHGHLIV